MRLKDNEITAIKESIKRFDADALVYLFGSRAYDEKKGGDIDLLILSSKIGNVEKRKLLTLLYDSIGEQKIDIIVANDVNIPFVKIALEEGVKL
ncbi:MAG: nucleotidyltransferase domain-containing protein [Nitrospirae bacterium]|nr:nucleotidyltransferase domain-containing protein [Nitrospirota bacterium]